MALKTWLNQKVELGSIPAWTIIVIPLILVTLFFGHAHTVIVSDIYNGMASDLKLNTSELYDSHHTTSPYREYIFMTRGREQGKFFVFGSHTDLYYDTYKDAFRDATYTSINDHKKFISNLLPTIHNNQIPSADCTNSPSNNNNVRRICSKSETQSAIKAITTKIQIEEKYHQIYLQNPTNSYSVANLYNTIKDTDKRIAQETSYLDEYVPPNTLPNDLTQKIDL